MIAISAANGAAGTGITLVARYPGRAGEVVVTFAVRESQNVLVTVDGTNTLRGVREFDTLRFKDGSLAVAVRSNSGSLEMLNNLGSPVDLAAASGPVQILTVIVTVRYPGGRPREDVWENLAFDARHRNSLQQLFGESVSLRRMPALTIPIIFRTDADTFTVAARLIAATKQPIPLTGGSDGDRPEAGLFIGQNADDPNRATGLVALENIPDISIVAAPGSSLGGQNGFATNAQQISNALIGHCQRMRYRIAVLDAPDEAAVSDIRGWRTQFDSTHAALYYPWVCTIDPLTGNELNLPPSGFVAGIYARNDIARGVHKAPANEVVRSAIRFERNLNKAHQDVLNPEGINCFRWFQGRGYRLWGARTISSDPEWKYVSLRRYFAYLERSIELGTQWVVFEPNGPELWANVKRTIEDFLFNEFKSGRLLGDSPETSYFVRCDRSTMTQNDIDNGRLICLIGVSPLRPAEFVIFRIGQWTADSNQ
ncbi:MAG: phage tail sheath family protein [Ardenticatenaceae bacterium]|nr:phage tail sheath family protein [Ardenticatenaceae bacterium]